MFKLYFKLEEGTNKVLYEIENIPHLWLYGTKNQTKISIEEFTDNLIELSTEIGDELFTNEIVNLITIIKSENSNEIELTANDNVYDKLEIIKSVQNLEYNKLFGNFVNKQEFYRTEKTHDYFNDYRSKYKSEYKNITNTLVTINIVVFIINMFVGYSPYQFIFGSPSLFTVGAWMQILLAGFTHLSFWHIFFNMSFLLSVGPILERLIGKKNFLVLYFASLIVSGVAVNLLTVNPTAGASGALYGLFAFFICYTLKYATNKRQVQNVLSTFGINILFTILTPSISIVGHLSGLIAGALFFITSNNPKL